MCPESKEHLKIKETVLDILKKQYGAGLKEYPDSGNIADAFVVTPDGVEIFVENVWTSSKGNFYRDLHILRNSNAKVKILIVNPEIIKDKLFEREYEKVRISERKRGITLSELIDGSLFLSDKEFIKKEFIQTIGILVASVGTQPIKGASPKMDRHSKSILLTRRDYQGLDQWAPEYLMTNLLLHAEDKLEIKYLMQHFKSGYFEEFWHPLIEYKEIMEKYNRLIIPCLGNEEILPNIKEIPKEEWEYLEKLNDNFIAKFEELIFAVKNGDSLKGSCDFCKGH
jgi:hypothetical protein